MAKKIIVGNWKMNPNSLKEAVAIFTKIKKTASRASKSKIIICPPFPFIGLFSLGNKSKVSVGAQNISEKTEGAFTGEVDGKMLFSLGVSNVIVGHSERRAMGETNEIVSQKLLQALGAKISPIVCIGEKERDEDGNFYTELRKMIEQSLQGLSKEKAKKIILAYEPVWAIGEKAKGVITPEALHETIIFIRRTLIESFGKSAGSAIPILYGGSVDENNAKEMVVKGHADGLLVGRASLNPEAFSKIISFVS